MILNGVREYVEEMDVEIKEYQNHYDKNDINNGRLVINAQNEGSLNCTEVDLMDLIKWIKINKPELLSEVVRDDAET